MNRHQRYLSDLVTLATAIPRAGAASISAALVMNNKIVSYGFNSYKTHPFQKKFGKNKDAVCIHAEIDAIKNALKKVNVDDLKYATLYIARAKNKDQNSKKDHWGLSKPCEGCCRAISSFNIKKVYYTTNENNRFECL